MLIISETVNKLLQTAQNSLQGYGPRSLTDDGSNSPYSERWVGDGGTSPWSRTDLAYRERVMDYDKIMREGMEDEWGEDMGQKPNGTVLKKVRKKKKDKNNKDLGYITEFERITRTNPKFIGRVQRHFRRKNDYSPGKTPPGLRGAWPHNREYYPKFPREEPETWEERTNRTMFL